MFYENTKILISRLLKLKSNGKSNLKNVLPALSVKSAVKYEIMIVKKKTDSLISHGSIFRKLSRLQILMRNKHVTLIDTIHNGNRLYWKLIIVMIQHEYNSWIACAYILYEHENRDIIATSLAIFDVDVKEKNVGNQVNLS